MADKGTKSIDPEANTLVWFDKMDGKEYRLSFEHAKLLYLVSHYARSSKSDEQPETWMRELSLDVLIYEGICAGKLDFDYAPVSRQYLYMDEDDGECKVKRLYLNLSQEARSAVDDLLEQEFIKSIKVPNDDNLTTSAFQCSSKGMDLLQALPPILRIEVDDFLYVRIGYKVRAHPKKDLLNVLTDKDGIILVTENGHEAPSGITQVEDVSYVTSPFLPWTYRIGEALCTDNSTRSWESGVGISQVKNELHESIILSQVNILIQEWIPIAANEFSTLLNRFGVKTRNAGGRFTAEVDRHPNNQLVHTKQGLTRIQLLDYDPAQCVNFESEIQFAEDEGVKQVEYIGIHLHIMGAVSCGFRVEAIQNRLADDVSCDLMSRMLVDVIQDTSTMLRDLLTESQRRTINTIYRGNAPSRTKFCIIFADKIDPHMKAASYKDGGEYENELRQVLGTIRKVKDVGVSGVSGNLVILGSDGILVVGRKLRKYDRITVEFGEVMSIQNFMKSFYSRLALLAGEIVKLKLFLENGSENPEFFENVRQLRNRVSTDLAVLEEMVTYLDDALEHLIIPSPPIEDVGKVLFDTLDVKGGIDAIYFQLNDVRKTVKGCRMSVNGLNKEILILQTKRERAVGLSIDQNTKRMVEVSHADRRSASVFSILRIMLGCSYGLLMLDAFISARAKYFGMKSMSHSQSNAVQLNGTESSSFTPNFDALSNVDVGDPTNGGSYFPMQAAIIFDQAPIIGTFSTHLIFMGIFVVLMRRLEAFFDTSGVRRVTCKFFKRINTPKLEAYIISKGLGKIYSCHVQKGTERGEHICEKTIRFVPPAPFPWTWHGPAPHIEMRVNFEGAQLISATFSRGESLPFWKWVVYNQILRRSQKMSMLAHLDEHMIDRFLQNLEEADVFTEWSPDLEREDRIKTPTFHEIPVEDNQLDILDPIENQTNGPDDEREALVDSEAIDVQYDEWGAEKDVKIEKGEDGERKRNEERFSTTKSGFFTRSSRGQTAASNVEDKGRPGATPAKRSWTPFAFGGKKGDNTGKSKWMSFTRTSKTQNEYE